MSTGKITIESGNKKAIISIVDTNVSIGFEPEICKIPENENEQFVHNATAIFIQALK